MFGDPKPYNPSSNDWKEEYQAAKYWDRPPRRDLRSTPYYPWAPTPKPYNVNFALNYK